MGSITPGIAILRISTVDAEKEYDSFACACRTEYTAAKKRVAEMDASDGHSQADVPIDAALRTVITAISAGLVRHDESIMYEAVVMLQQIEHETRKRSMAGNAIAVRVQEQ